MNPKRPLFVLLFLSVSMLSRAQTDATGYLYADAVSLYTQLYETTPASRETVSKILLYYSFKSGRTPEQVVSENEFLKSVLLLQNFRTASGASDFARPNGVGVGSLMGMDVSKYADGLAKFLIERGKQELSIAFFERMQRELKKYPELTAVFPKTSVILYGIQNYNILTLLQELRDAFVKDMLATPENILNIREYGISCSGVAGDDLENCKKRLDNINSALKKSEFIITLHAMKGMIDGQLMPGIVNSIVNDVHFKGKEGESINYLRFVNLIFDGLRSSEQSEGIFIKELSVRTLFENEELLQIFIGLMFEKYRAAPAYAKFTLSKNELNKILAAIISNRTSFASVLASFDNVNNSFLALKDTRRDRSNDDKLYASLIGSSFTATAYTLKSVQSITNTTSLPDSLKRILVNLEIGSDMVIDIHHKNFSGIYNDLIRLNEHNRFITDKKAKEALTKYLSFAANMASAQTSDDVKNAIDVAVMPAGSYSVKQRAGYNIAMNAYVGYGWDLHSGEVKAHGIYAPLGFTFSKGLHKERGGALSIFASVVDVGSLVSYRLKNGMTDELKQEVRLESIISPSAQLIVGIPRWPISLAAGWRKTPKLFYKSDDTFLVITPRNRLNLGIMIDIPMFNFYTRSYE
jgi:hypothetical protein